MKKQLTRSIFIALALAAMLAITGCALGGAASGPNATPDGLDTGLVGETAITESIEASGTVNASQQAQLAWKTSGIVDQVNVKAGDQVKDGDVLASLELTSVPASVLAAQADLINAEQALENLSPTALAIVQAEQKVAQAQDNVEQQQRIVDGLGTPAKQSDIDQANATVLLNKIQLDKAWDRYEPYQNKPDDNPIRAGLYNRWAQAQQLYDQSVQRLNNLRSISVNQTDKALAEANLVLAKAQLTDAQENLAELKVGADAQDVAAAEARIIAAKATLSALSLAAPFDGEILVVDVQPGDVVSASQAAFSLADRSTLHVDTLIDETDIADVKVGDKVELTLDSLPGVTLTGTVGFINPLGEKVSGNVKYSVRVDLDPLDQPVLLGATADVVIQTGAPRQALSVPVRAIQTDASGEFVNLIGKDGTLQRIDVTTGALLGDQVVILSGDLLAGDQVQLAAADNEMFNRMQDNMQR